MTVVPVDKKVRNLVAEAVPGEFVGWVALDEKAAIGVKPAGPLFEVTGLLEFGPVFRALEDVDVGFAVAGRLGLV